MAGPLQFWKLIKEVNPRHVQEEADRAFTAAAIASPDALETLRARAGLGTEAARHFAGDRWFEAALPLMPEARHRLSRCSFALALSSDDARESPVITWALPADPGPTGADISEILDRFPHLMIALPRYIPMFRADATRRVIAATAKANTEVSLVTAIPGILPWTAPLLPATAFPDMVLLTKNQGMMILRIAAIHGREVHPRERLAELGGVVGAAFGWRAMARQIVGAVPGGAGAAAKGAIAYAATVAAGRAAQTFYTTGRAPTEAQQRTWYNEARGRATTVVAEIMERLRRKEPDTTTA